MAAAGIDLTLPVVATVGLLATGLMTPAMAGVVAGWTLFYFFATEASTGQTFGKRLMHLRVASADGGQPSLHQLVARTIARIVDVMVLAIIALLRTGAPHFHLDDAVAGTTVLDSAGAPQRPGLLARLVEVIGAELASARGTAPPTPRSPKVRAEIVKAPRRAPRKAPPAPAAIPPRPASAPPKPTPQPAAAPARELAPVPKPADAPVPEHVAPPAPPKLRPLAPQGDPTPAVVAQADGSAAKAPVPELRALPDIVAELFTPDPKREPKLEVAPEPPQAPEPLRQGTDEGEPPVAPV